MWYILVIGAIVGVLLLGLWVASQNPKFWLGLLDGLYEKFLPDFLKIIKNRPKTPEEWADWRRLSAMKKSDMSPKDIARYEELKKLNEEYRKNK